MAFYPGLGRFFRACHGNRICVLLVIIMNVIMNVASGESLFCINIFIPDGSESIF